MIEIHERGLKPVIYDEDGDPRCLVIWHDGDVFHAGYYSKWEGGEAYIDAYPHPNEEGSTLEEALLNLYQVMKDKKYE